MNVLLAVWNATKSLLVSKPALADTPGSTLIIAQIMHTPLTVGEVSAALVALEHVPWSDIRASVVNRLSNVQEDLVTLEAIADVLAELGVPFAGDVELSLKIAALVLRLTSPPTALQTNK